MYMFSTQNFFPLKTFYQINATRKNAARNHSDHYVVELSWSAECSETFYCFQKFYDPMFGDVS